MDEKQVYSFEDFVKGLNEASYIDPQIRIKLILLYIERYYGFTLTRKNDIVTS